MSDVVIKAEGLGKKYLIGHQSERERYTALRDVLARNVKGVLNKTRQVLSGQQLLSGDEIEEFWALKNIDFEIKKGDRVGIIGRNGAGKSTLLKILSRITEPSEGRVEINGRVASLLEVGTGFHPELTGRENVFLNGAILGMTRAEIRRKFDEIVDFAGVEKFLDTPVKRYSSGMYVRLAFAVAAHMEPEILIVDEVLAVGDAEFQKKCLGKMEDVSRNEGRTVLFVSHNLGAVKLLCNTSILLHKGEKILQGEVLDSLIEYKNVEKTEIKNQKIYERQVYPINKKTYIQSVEMIDDQNIDFFRLHLKLTILAKTASKIGINLRLKDAMSFPVGAGFTHYFKPELITLHPGINTVSLISSNLALAVGSYKLSLELVLPGIEFLDILEDCIQFELSNGDLSNISYGIEQSWGYGAIEITFTQVDNA